MAAKNYEFQTRTFSLKISVNWLAVRCVIVTSLLLAGLAWAMPKLRLTLVGLLILLWIGVIFYCCSPGSGGTAGTVTKAKIKSKKHVVKPPKTQDQERVSAEMEVSEVSDEDQPPMKKLKSPTQIESESTPTPAPIPPEVDRDATAQENYDKVYEQLDSLSDLI